VNTIVLAAKIYTLNIGELHPRDLGSFCIFGVATGLGPIAYMSSYKRMAERLTEFLEEFSRVLNSIVTPGLDCRVYQWSMYDFLN
jgi:hypothetical protein